MAISISFFGEDDSARMAANPTPGKIGLALRLGYPFLER
jgi:hypothetical protein